MDDVPTEPSTFEPPNEALVVRGGEIRTVAQLRSQAQGNLVDYGEHSLSVFASVEHDVAGIVRAAREAGAATGDRNLAHGKLHKTTAQRIREAGFELIATPPPPDHCSLMVPEDAEDHVYEALIGAFDPVEKNPLGRMP